MQSYSRFVHRIARQFCHCLAFTVTSLFLISQKPTDKDARAKLAECERQVKRILFEEAIASEYDRSAVSKIDPTAIGACTHARFAPYGGSTAPHSLPQFSFGNQDELWLYEYLLGLCFIFVFRLYVCS